MTILRALPVTLLLLLPACESASDTDLARRCERAIAKVALDATQASSAPSSKPSPGEQAIIDSVRKASQAKCEAEGLTVEQAACFDDIVDVETLFMAADCPAIAANKPSWFSVPPPEVRQEALREMRARRASESGKPPDATP